MMKGRKSLCDRCNCNRPIRVNVTHVLIGWSIIHSLHIKLHFDRVKAKGRKNKQKIHNQIDREREKIKVIIKGFRKFYQQVGYMVLNVYKDVVPIKCFIRKNLYI